MIASVQETVFQVACGERRQSLSFVSAGNALEEAVGWCLTDLRELRFIPSGTACDTLTSV